MTLKHGNYTAVQHGRSVYVSDGSGKMIVHITLADDRSLNENELANLISEVERRK